MTESQIQETIVAWLSAVSRQYGFLFFSVPNEGLLMLCKMLKIPDRLSFALLAILKKMGLTPGVSDLILGWRGRMFALEIKTPRGTQSDRQKIFEAWCADCGIPYAIVRSLDDARDAMVEWGIAPAGAPRRT